MMKSSPQWPRALFLHEWEIKNTSLSPECFENALKRWYLKSGLSLEHKDILFKKLASLSWNKETFLSCIDTMPTWAWNKKTIVSSILQASPLRKSGWEKTLMSLLEEFDKPMPFQVPDCFDFPEALERFVCYGICAVSTCIELFCPLFLSRDLIMADLRKGLCDRLLYLCSNTLVMELNVTRVKGHLSGETSEERFSNYCGLFTTDKTRWRKLLEEYQVLGRLMAVHLDQWVVETKEMLTRLKEDWDLLKNTFFQGRDVVLSHLEGGLSDLHRGGKSVWVLKFRVENETVHLVYKPKPLQIDSLFQELLKTINRDIHRKHIFLEEFSTPFSFFYVTTILDRGSYGWSEFIEHQPCHSVEEVSNFYFLQGAFLALLSLLGATDMHLRNLIARGPYPVFIDLETLFYSPLEQKQISSADDLAELILNEMTRIGLLPDYSWGAQVGKGTNIAGMGSENIQSLPFSVPAWENNGTDKMRLGISHANLELAQNLPYLNGKPISAAHYTKKIVAGFKAMYSYLQEERIQFLRHLQGFRLATVRHVFRATSFYTKMLEGLLHPNSLRNAIDWDYCLDGLWGISRADTKRCLLISSEQTDLREGNIPYFQTRVDSRHLWDSRGICFKNFFGESGWEATIRRLHSMSDKDLFIRTGIIQQALTTLSSKPAGSLQVNPQSRDIPHFWGPTVQHPLKLAVLIGERLAASAIDTGDQASWIGLNYDSQDNPQLAIIPADLYNGTAGIALFLAVLSRLSNQSRFLDFAIKVISSRPLAVAKKESIIAHGGYVGVPSQLYVWHFFKNFFGLDFFPNNFSQILDTVEQTINQDRVFDIIGGAAGTLSVLLECGDERAFKIALHCGDHLVTHARDTEHGKGWARFNENAPMLLGFSHGVAGIAWALMALADVCRGHKALAKKVEVYTATAEAALAYERDLFDETIGNWPDLRNEPLPSHGHSPVTMAAWCHGAAGIALSRILMLPLCHDKTLIREIEVGIETTLREGMGHNHSLCHGDLGNGMIILKAARDLGRKEWKIRFQSHINRLLREIAFQGPRCGMPEKVEVPGLMCGLAGIGLGLLFLYEPQEVPFILGLKI